MRRRHGATRLVMVVGVGAIAATAFVGGSAAQAAPSATGSSRLVSRSGPAHDTQATLDYWTPTRMANAKPEPISTAATNDVAAAAAPAPASSSAKPVVIPGVLGSAPASSAIQAPAALAAPLVRQVPRPYTNYPDRLNGVIFYTKVRTNGTTAGDFRCSGAVVNSTNKDMVVTAGHCVHGGPGFTWHKRWKFVPAYSSTKDGERRYGTYVERDLAAMTDWISSGGLRQDVGIALVQSTQAGAVDIVTRLGANGIMFNIDRKRTFHGFGYPCDTICDANATFNGYRQWRCDSPVTNQGRVQGTGPTSMGIRCDLTPGISGGPWLIGMQANGLGNVNGVFSHSISGFPHRVFSPYFGAAVESLYNLMKAA